MLLRNPGSLLIISLLFFAGTSNAQQHTYYFSPLSSAVYTKNIAAIKERPIPVMYADKAAQKTYAEIIKERDESILADLEKNQVLYDTLLLNKCNSILQKIKTANSSFSFNNISIYINRSPVANASCYGEGTLFVNMGLFLWIDNDDELALIIGHELSHQLLKHAESRINKNIALLSSEDFKNEIKAIKKSDDGKYERYKQLLKELATENGTHSRYKETEADSLAQVLIKNAGYNVKGAAAVLLKLDHVDDLFVSKNLYTVKTAFKNSVVDSFVLEQKGKYHGLSMVKVTMNADKDFDSIKTHPDCIARYQKLMDANTEKPVINCCTGISNSLKDIKERALVELIRYEYEANRLTLCVHLCLFALQNNYDPGFYTNFLSLSFSAMYEADKKLQKFSATDAKAKAGSTLKELQDFIFNANSTNLANIAAFFLNNAPDKNSEDFLFAELMYNTQVKLQNAAGLQKRFINNFPHSKYSYLINPTKN